MPKDLSLCRECQSRQMNNFPVPEISRQTDLAMKTH